MALAIDLVQRVDVSRRRRKLIYKVTPSGSYTTGGDTLNFSTATNSSGSPHPLPDQIPSDDQVVIEGVKGGYSADFVAGTTMANSKMIFYSTANTQILQAAYPGALTSAYISVSQSFGRSKG